MNIQQIKNLYSYTAIMLIDNYIISTSPDYLKEKSLKFFGTLGKSEFINFPEIKFQSQVSVLRMGKKVFNSKDFDFWKKYTKNWCVGQDDYELMNIINFLLNVHPIYVEEKKSLTIKNFEKYIGDINLLSTRDLSYMAHFKITEYINKNTNFNNRYFKLMILNSMK